MKQTKNKISSIAVCALLMCLIFASCGTAELRVNEEMQSELDARRGLGPPTVTLVEERDCSSGHVPRWDITKTTHMRYCSVCGETLLAEENHEPWEIAYMRGYLVIDDRTYTFRSFECGECGARLEKTYTPLVETESEVGG